VDALIVVSVLLGFLVVAGVSVARVRLERRHRLDHWRTWALERGCHFSEPPGGGLIDPELGRITGFYEGLELDMRLLTAQARDEVGKSTTISFPLPDFLPALDGERSLVRPGQASSLKELGVSLARRARDDQDPAGATWRETASDEAFLQDLLRLSRSGASYTRHRGCLEVRYPLHVHKDIERYVRQVLQLTQALTEVALLPFRRLAARHGLREDLIYERIQLEGQVDGQELTVFGGLLPGKPGPWTVIDVSMPEALPQGLRVALRDRRGHEPRLRLGDPILDPLLHVECRQPERARRLLADDELRGALLEVVHGHPGSCVGDDAVTLEVEGLAGEELDGLVEAVLALAASLRRRVGELD